MFVTVYTYRARAGEEDAIIALHEDWARNQRSHARGYLSGDLLAGIHDSRTFVEIARYESEGVARVVAEDPDQIAWRHRLASLTETEPAFTVYHSTWRDP